MSTARLARAVGAHGLIGTFARIPRFVKRKLSSIPYELRYRWKERLEGFDGIHGTDTSAPSEPLDIGSKDASLVFRYEATHASEIRHALEIVRPLAPTRTLIDLGCGKGRVLLVAPEFGFKKIIGVELSAGLSKIAQHNVELFKRNNQQSAAIEVECVNALQFEFPNEPMVLYMFNPFSAQIVEALFERLRQTLLERPTSVDIVYVFPAHADILERCGFKLRQRESRHSWFQWDPSTQASGAPKPNA